ncbi:hypothetical protein [Nocardia sp. NPDC059195]|uniref:hypothetical protein n=2 Tax=unclassified Nocardia TaxID=2637762 RepID=UPI003697BEE8
MSNVLLAVHDLVGPVLAMSPAPEAPPASERLLQLVRYLSWLALLLVPVLVIVVVVVLVRVLRSRSTEPSLPPHRTPPSSPAPAPPTADAPAPPSSSRPLRGGWHAVPDPTDRPSAVPDLPLPGADGWPPPDPTVWGRPGQS